MILDFLRPYMKDPTIVDRVHMHTTIFIPKGYVAFTLGHHVFMLSNLNVRRVMAHEIKHVEQIEDVGFIRFYLSYFYQFFRYGYRNIDFEIEARSFAARVLNS